MMGFAEITVENARKSDVDEGIISNLSTIAAEAGRMADIMEEMREFALAREYTKDRRPVDLSSVIHQMGGLYSKVLERHGIRLVMSAADNIPPIYGNDNELTQVLFNLLRNAETHTENGEVTIRADIQGALVKVTVSDTGTGIVPEILPRVFERGVHGGSGSGFGLAICRDIITAYDGEIWLESDGVNGTQAIFTLPIYRGADNE
jgi:signal transduction histidine kinase